MKNKIPRWILKKDEMTSREWKQHKRYQARVFERAFNNFRLGCAYTPGYKFVRHIEKNLRQLRESMTVRNWGN